MIPLFNKFGCLPPGIHPATLEEIDARFGRSSEIRRVQMESVRWMVELAVRAAIERIILNGSFVTDIFEPNDVDCVLLVESKTRRNRAAMVELEKGLPFLDIAVVRPLAFNEYVQNVFAADRMGVPKGLVEVIQWI